MNGVVSTWTFGRLQTASRVGFCCPTSAPCDVLAAERSFASGDRLIDTLPQLCLARVPAQNHVRPVLYQISGANSDLRISTNIGHSHLFLFGARCGFEFKITVVLHISRRHCSVAVDVQPFSDVFKSHQLEPFAAPPCCPIFGTRPFVPSLR